MPGEEPKRVERRLPGEGERQLCGPALGTGGTILQIRDYKHDLVRHRNFVLQDIVTF